MLIHILKLLLPQLHKIPRPLRFQFLEDAVQRWGAFIVEEMADDGLSGVGGMHAERRK